MSACCHNTKGVTVASTLPDDADETGSTITPETRAALSRLASADAKPNAAQRRTNADRAYLNGLSNRLAEWR